MSVMILTELHLEFQGLKGGGTGSSESTLVKMPHCCKSHVTAHLIVVVIIRINTINQNIVYHMTAGSEIAPCNKICKPLVVYRFSGNVMTSIKVLSHYNVLANVCRRMKYISSTLAYAEI